MSIYVYGHGRTLDLAEAEELHGYLGRQIEAERERLEHPVQVRYMGGVGKGDLYTYSDPSGTVGVGDTVEVKAAGYIKMAKVEALGRGTCAPRELNPILAVYSKREL